MQKILLYASFVILCLAIHYWFVKISYVGAAHDECIVDVVGECQGQASEMIAKTGKKLAKLEWLHVNLMYNRNLDGVYFTCSNNLARVTT